MPPITGVRCGVNGSVYNGAGGTQAQTQAERETALRKELIEKLQYTEIPSSLIIPTPLTPRWTPWLEKPPEKPGAKPSKPSIDVRTGYYGDVDGETVWTGMSYAKVNDPATWTDFLTACRYMNEKLLPLRKPCGIAFSLNGDGIIGIDLDGCVNEDDTISDEAMQTIREIDSYTEISPSGSGLRIMVRGQLPEGHKCKKLGPDGKAVIEVYSTAKFLSITGTRLRLRGLSAEVEYRPCAVLSWYNRVFCNSTSTFVPNPGSTKKRKIGPRLTPARYRQSMRPSWRPCSSAGRTRATSTTAPGVSTRRNPRPTWRWPTWPWRRAGLTRRFAICS
jgi:hypothetical protein